MACYFVIVGHHDNPIFEIEFLRTDNSKEDRRHLNQFIAHASLDIVDEMKWQNGNLFLRTVDRFNELAVTGFVTASNMKFLLVHDNSVRSDSVKAFFGDLYEHFIKALLNPFYEPNTPIKSQNFRKKVLSVARRTGIGN